MRIYGLDLGRPARRPERPAGIIMLPPSATTKGDRRPVVRLQVLTAITAKDHRPISATVCYGASHCARPLSTGWHGWEPGLVAADPFCRPSATGHLFPPVPAQFEFRAFCALVKQLTAMAQTAIGPVEDSSNQMTILLAMGQCQAMPSEAAWPRPLPSAGLAALLR
jgi:hypothetical protein